MLKQNDPVRKLLNVDVWHKAGYTGKDVIIVLLDDKGKARENMKDYYTDVLGEQTEIGHATNVGFTAHELGPGIQVVMFDSGRDLDEAIAWIKVHNVDLINISQVGRGGTPTPQFLTLEDLGIPVICASGNDDYEDKISYPAAYPFTIAIGAYNWENDDVAYYSNEGKELDAVAPSGIYMQRDDGYVWSVSGTSFAAPTVCGLLACYIQWRNEHGLPKLKTEEARKFIRENCKDIEEEGFDKASGYGLFCLPATIPALNPEEPSRPVITEPIKEKENLPMKIFIDPGHGGSDPGAVSIVKEADFTLSYGWELARVLRLMGFDVKESRTSDYSVSLANRCMMANDWVADYFISLHFNAGGGVGIETYALASGGRAESLAGAVQRSVIEATKTTDRGVKFANFQVLRDTSMPAILIEGGFVDNDADAQKIQSEDYKRNYIRGVTKGICEAIGASWKDPYAAATPPVDPPATPIEDKDIYLSVRVLQSKAEQAIKDINKLGFAAKVMDLA